MEDDEILRVQLVTYFGHKLLSTDLHDSQLSSKTEYQKFTNNYLPHHFKFRCLLQKYNHILKLHIVV